MPGQGALGIRVVTDFAEVLWREKATAIIRSGSQEVAASAMDAAVRGGFRIIEFTMTTPGVLELVRHFAARPGLIVGAGTVLTRRQADDAVRAGAGFLVSPVFDEAIVEHAASLGVASMPGVHTASEMWRAHRAGATLLKLFPAAAGGPAYVRAILAAMPFLRIVPTHGADAENTAAYLQAGAFALGFVNPLFEPADLAAARWDAIEARARRFRALVTGVERADIPERYSEPTDEARP